MFYSIVICDNCYVIHKCRHDDLTYGRNSHNFLEHSSPLFNQLTILDVFKLHKYLVGVFVYDLIHNNLPHSITDYCSLFNYEYNTRQKAQGNLCIPPVKTSVGQQSISYTGVVSRRVERYKYG